MKKLISILFLVIFALQLPAQANIDVFNDVPEQQFNREAIEYLKTNKIVQGYKSGDYKPENRINRAEFTKILVEAQYKEDEINNCISENVKANLNYVYFPDIKREDWFAKYVCIAKANKIIDGYPDGNFKPSNYINFAEASKIISEALDIKEDKSETNGEWFAGYIKGLEKKKAIPSTIQFFDKNISRGEMAELIWRLKENKTDKISTNYDELTSDFPKIQSCEALKEKFIEYQSYNNIMPVLYRGGIVEDSMEMVKSMPASIAPEADFAESNSGSNSYSETNVQVKGVDEADIIKNDGKYIYLIKNNTVRIFQAYPANEMKEVSSIEFDIRNFNPNELYISDNKLIAIGNSYKEYNFPQPIPMGKMMMPYPYHGARTQVFIYDISDKSNPKEMRSIAYDGNYKTSRRVGDNLYLILNENANVWRINDVKNGEDLLPKFQEGNGDVQDITECGNIHYFPGYERPNYLIISSININDSKKEIKNEVYLGSSDNVYSSRVNLYIATNRMNYDRYTDRSERENKRKTTIYKFALNDGDVEFKSRGSVPGKILNQFSMDAYIDNFRIATTTGNTWNEKNPSESNVYILDKDMKIVGQLEGLAPGERIYSTRFMGEKLYMVTFKQVDPLFVIDLKNPKLPKLLGKLKIPGFSDYLHPYDTNHIIGFGKDTGVNKWGNTTIRGVKMALFDVSDASNPKQKFTEIIGDQGTYSELLNNHKALLFDKDKKILAFPIRINEKVNSKSLQCTSYRYSDCPNKCQKRCIPSSCTEDNEGRAICTDDCGGLGSCMDPNYERYETTFSGALVYNIDLKNGFKERGRISHYNNEDIDKMGNYWPHNYEKNIQRIIYIGKNLYTISQGLIKASDINTIEEKNKVEIK